jgi:hypothetical protein
MTPDHPEQLSADELAIFRTDALLDAIIDGRPWRHEDELRFLLAGPFGVDWRAGHPHRSPTHQLGAHRPGAGPRRDRGPAPGPAVERRPHRRRLRRQAPAQTTTATNPPAPAESQGGPSCPRPSA